MRTLRQSKDPQAQVAIDMFVYRVTRESGALAACLNGVDVLAFTGGIGEHDAQLRADVVAGLAYLGLKIDLKKIWLPTVIKLLQFMPAIVCRKSG